MLPAEYVSADVELGYASTGHRAQGRTVDTAHAYITAATMREPLYVMATRGRECNRLYVDTADDANVPSEHDISSGVRLDPAGLLRQALTTSGADMAATEVSRKERHAAERALAYGAKKTWAGPAL